MLTLRCVYGLCRIPYLNVHILNYFLLVSLVHFAPACDTPFLFSFEISEPLRSVCIQFDALKYVSTKTFKFHWLLVLTALWYYKKYNWNECLFLFNNGMLRIIKDVLFITTLKNTWLAKRFFLTISFLTINKIIIFI